MQKKSGNKDIINALCPMARALEQVSDPWSVLIMRDAFYGVTRFDEFEKSLGIAPNILTRRLTTLVAEGLLERRQYCERPPRFEYAMTARGRDFRPILLKLMAWGTKHFSPEGPTLLLVDQSTGAVVEPVLVDSASGKLINEREHVCVAGPAASEGMKQRLAARKPRAEPPAE
jgi:DNA-binding HxlR family transcriptional regulator